MANFVRCGGSLGLLTSVALLGCADQVTPKKVAQVFQARHDTPDEKPRMLNEDLPFHYPPALYARKVQGNVTLRLYVDRAGQVTPDSTRIEESSGYAGLDSAAVKGSQDLRFAPATLRGEPLGVAILFPVYFRHPEARALPGDTILRRMMPAATPAATREPR
ncbi:MAG TPA: energy transducer TonB [Gemmatimonadaceae bacterium]|nr:energy transducer TonB [Gemmatimonadaceae bacterium]